MTTTYMSRDIRPTAPPKARTRRPAGSWSRYMNPVLGITGLVVVLAAWQICTTTGIVDANFSSSPAGAARALIDSVRTGDIWAPLGSTLTVVAWGMAISLVLGIPLGLLIGRNRVLYALTDPLISIMYSVPYVVFLPIIIFWFGIDAQARVVIVVWSAVFPLLINVIAGARNLDQNLLHVSQSFCAGKLLTLRSVAFPATLPYILAGVRQAVGRGLVGAIVAELFMGSAGLGYVVQLKTSAFQMDDAMAAIAVIAIVAIALTRSIGYLEKRFTFWSVAD
ncbi:ABC transporter permease [Nocardioides sp. KR10-350]|uniref:ABC transporter permease n=1 Tax=Nocardioides cheoyonin TaxID=3156615 RepID=UPI0032B53EBF